MYGFLRPANKLLTKEAKQAYARIYCGQCVALHDHFGYVQRALTSYDAAFIGLLLSAQQENPDRLDRRCCAMFPRKKEIVAPHEATVHYAAALAVTLGAIKLKDRQQEKAAPLSHFIEKSFSRTILKAKATLGDYGIPDALLSTTLNAQHRVEQENNTDVLTYARPTEGYLRELFGITAILANKPENRIHLEEIGTGLGRIIYLVDSCVDLLDDMDKKEFNAILAAYANDDGGLCQYTGDRMTDLILQSLNTIRLELSQLALNRHQELIGNILFAGFPSAILGRLTSSAKKIKKHQPGLLKYAPHTALATALCLAGPSLVEAATGYIERPIVCGSINTGDNCLCIIGCTANNLGSPDKYTNFLGCLDLFLNPCFYMFECGPNCKGCFSAILSPVCQAPKAYFSWRTFTKITANLKTRKSEKQKTFKENAFAKLQDLYHNISLSHSHDPDPAWNQLETNTRVTNEKKLEKIFLRSEKNNKHVELFLQHSKTDWGRTDQVIKQAKALKNKISRLVLSPKINDRTTNQLKLYDELISPTELAPLLADHRFEDIKAITDEISRYLENIQTQ